MLIMLKKRFIQTLLSIFCTLHIVYGASLSWTLPETTPQSVNMEPTILNKIDRCQNSLMIERLRIKYPKTVAISALKQEGFDLLQDAMAKEIAKLRKQVKLRIPQSHYALVSELLRDGKVSSCEYEENDILLEVEIPRILEKKVALFEVSF